MTWIFTQSGQQFGLLHPTAAVIRFPADYLISHGADGKPFTKTQQVHMCGNSVSASPMVALARANDPWRQVEQIKEAE